MNSTVIRSAAALVMMAAVPAFASDKGGAAAPMPQSTPSATKYCLSPSQLPPAIETGTIIKKQPKRECLTRKQWADKGISFDVK